MLQSLSYPMSKPEPLMVGTPHNQPEKEDDPIRSMQSAVVLCGLVLAAMGVRAITTVDPSDRSSSALVICVTTYYHLPGADLGKLDDAKAMAKALKSAGWRLSRPLSANATCPTHLLVGIWHGGRSAHLRRR